jgi:hypothetical protein
VLVDAHIDLVVIVPREFLRLNDECADKIYDIREQSDFSRECLLNADGVASRFYQMEADAVSDIVLLFVDDVRSMIDSCFS